MPQLHSSNKKLGRSALWYWRRFLLTFIPFLLFSLCLFPIIVMHWFYFQYFFYQSWWGLVVFPFFLLISLVILFLCCLFITAGVIRLFHITYNEGTYPYTLKEKNVFHWMLVCQLYTPMRKLLDAVPLGSIKTIYLRTLGMKIGSNCLVGGVIKDPCMTSFGDNVTMGEYAVLYAHIHDKSTNTLHIQPVTIGYNCVIGAGALIMPGVQMKRGSVVGAGGLVPKNCVLNKGKTYIGHPVKEKTKRQGKG